MGDWVVVTGVELEVVGGEEGVSLVFPRAPLGGFDEGEDEG